jgi:hypothetical protein
MFVNTVTVVVPWSVRLPVNTPAGGVAEQPAPGVKSGVGVRVGVPAAQISPVGVGVLVAVGVFVGVSEAVLVGVAVGVLVAVDVGVAVGVGV